MQIQSTRFGTLEVGEKDLITFPEGLPGLEGKQFALLPDRLSPAVFWLQSLRAPATSLAITDPLGLDPGWAGRPKPEELLLIQPKDAKLLVVKVVVRRATEPGQLVANFFAPIFMNLERRLAVQIPLMGSPYSPRHVLPEPPADLLASAPA